MRKQFNLQDWLKDKSQKVETRDGRPVKIISFEMTDTNDCPIAAQFRLCAGTPVVCLFDKEGHYKGEGDSDYDLFIVTPEPELSEFEKGYMRIVHKMKPEDFNDDGLKIAKEEAAELLDLARKEIIDRWSNGLRDTQDRSGKAYSDGYKLGHENGKAEALKEIEQDPESSYAFKRGVEYGKEEALKDLPRWKKAIGHFFVEQSIMYDDHGFYISCVTKPGCRYITCDTMAKLPGFND